MPAGKFLLVLSKALDPFQLRDFLDMIQPNFPCHSKFQLQIESNPQICRIWHEKICVVFGFDLYESLHSFWYHFRAMAGPQALEASPPPKPHLCNKVIPMSQQSKTTATTPEYVGHVVLASIVISLLFILILRVKNYFLICERFNLFFWIIYISVLVCFLSKFL